MTCPTDAWRATAPVGTDAGSAQRPNQILADPLCANPNPACWINKNAFSIPALGTLGSLGRASIPGPGFSELDVSLTRNLRLRETMVRQLRGEAFKLTNSFRAGFASGASAGAPGVNLNVNSPQFGQILNALAAQVAAKFSF